MNIYTAQYTVVPLLSRALTQHHKTAYNFSGFQSYLEPPFRVNVSHKIDISQLHHFATSPSSLSILHTDYFVAVLLVSHLQSGAHVAFLYFNTSVA